MDATVEVRNAVCNIASCLPTQMSVNSERLSITLVVGAALFQVTSPVTKEWKAPKVWPPKSNIPIGRLTKVAPSSGEALVSYNADHIKQAYSYALAQHVKSLLKSGAEQEQLMKAHTAGPSKHESMIATLQA